jgi:diamine N-acetyltransferase
MIKGDKIALREVSFSDAPLLMIWENDPENAIHTDQKTTYSFEEITQLIDSASDIRENGQQRWMILKINGLESIGTLDFFAYKPEGKSIDIGVLIQDISNRRKGYAKEALVLAEEVAGKFGLDYINCTVKTDNLASQKLFEALGYRLMETAEEKNEILMQKWLGK